MTSSNLESKYDRLVNDNYLKIINDISGSQDIFDAQKIPHFLKNSIKSKCLQYEYIVSSGDTDKQIIDLKKKLKKEISEEFGLFKQSKDDYIHILSQRIEKIQESNFSLKLFMILSKHFNFTFNQVEGKFKKLWKITHIKQFYEEHNKIREIESEFADATKRVQRHHEVMGRWRPQEITKGSLIERLNQLQIKPSVIAEINKIDEKTCFKNKNLTKISDDLDLIITSENDYYLIFKSEVLGQGTSKEVCRGINLSKNQPIAAAYALPGAVSRVLEEEKNIITLKETLSAEERKGIGKTKDCLHLTSNAEKEVDGVIFISSLYETDLTEVEDKVQFGIKIIKTIHGLVKKGHLPSDIKPRNICRKDQDPICIDIDLGQGRSRPYLAPELLKQPDATRNEKSVIWSLGMTLYEIYCNDHLLNHLYPSENLLSGNLPTESLPNAIKGLKNEEIDQQIKELKETEGIDSSHPIFLEMIRLMLRTDPNNRIDFNTIERFAGTF